MTLTAEEVRIGQYGGLSVAPLGTAAPTDAGTPLPAVWRDLGYFSDDGVTESWSDTITNIQAWQNAVTVRSVTTESTGTVAVTMIQTNKDTLEAFFKGSKVVAGTAAGEYMMDVVPPKAGARAWVLDWFDGDLHTRMYLPNAEVTERGDIVYQNGAAVGYPITITCYPSATIDGNLMRKWSNDPAWNPEDTIPVAAPTAVTLGTPTSTGLTLNWSYAAGSGEPATGFEVAIRTPKTTGTWGAPVTKSASATSHAFSGLTASTEYEARIRSIGAETQSDYVLVTGTTSA